MWCRYQVVRGDDGFGGHVLSSVVAQEVLQLKVGAKVISCCPLSDSIPNGSSGVVLRFRSLAEVREEDGLDEDGCRRRFNCSKAEINEWWDQMNDGRRFPEVEFTVHKYNERSGQMETSRQVCVHANLCMNVGECIDGVTCTH